MKITFKKLIFIAVVLIIFVVVVIGTLRILSGEDNWICENGEWVMHGHPDAPAPTSKCR